MTWDTLDPQIQALFIQVHGDNAQAVWEQENAVNTAPQMNVGGTPYGPSQDYQAPGATMYGPPNPQYPSNAPSINPDGTVGGVPGVPKYTGQASQMRGGPATGDFWADYARANNYAGLGIPEGAQAITPDRNEVRYKVWDANTQQWIQRSVRAPDGSGFDQRTGLKLGRNVDPNTGFEIPGGTGAGGQGQIKALNTGTNDAYTDLLRNQAATAAATQAAKAAYDAAMIKYQNDGLAETIAQNAWSRAYQEKSQAFTQEQATKGNAYTEAGITGTFNGAPTLARQGQENSTALSLLNLNAGLRGPSNYLTQLRSLSNTPQGLTSLVNNLTGKYGQQVSSMQTSLPGSVYERQSVGTLTRDMNAAPAGSNDASGLSLPGGSTWNAAAANTLLKNPTQAGLLKNLYEESGRSFEDEYANFLSSLPRYGGSRTSQLQL